MPAPPSRMAGIPERVAVPEPTAEHGRGERVWLTTRSGARYLDLKTPQAFIRWCHKNRIVLIRRGAGGKLIAERRDIDRVLEQERRKFAR
jgi:hypothetical protein